MKIFITIMKTELTIIRLNLPKSKVKKKKTLLLVCQRSKRPSLPEFILLTPGSQEKDLGQKVDS